MDAVPQVERLTPEEWVACGYRLFFGRAPESAEVIQPHLEGEFSLDAMRRALMTSEEFRSQLAPVPVPASEPEDEFQRLRAVFAQEGFAGQEGFFTDVFGVRTRCSYLPAEFVRYSGIVEHLDGSGHVPLHDPAEVSALLRTLLECEGSFSIVELGAGWGPWLVAGAVLARRRGLTVRLAGVEGDEAHHGFLRQHMTDNGIDPDEHQLLHAVVGPADGQARFPALADPSDDWGAEADFGNGPLTRGKRAGTRYVEMPAVSIRTALADFDHVDLVHCDIQGAEADALEASVDALGAKVKRMVVGTHGRGIEDRLLSLLAGAGWVLEHEQPCLVGQEGSRMELRRDGVQVWSNPAAASLRPL